MGNCSQHLIMHHGPFRMNDSRGAGVTLGPGRLGDLIESIAVPEIRQQAVELASTLAERMRSRSVLTERTATRSAPAELTGELVVA